MEAMPIICPTCGELVIACPGTERYTLVVPRHPDRVMPFEECAAGARAIKVSSRLSH